MTSVLVYTRLRRGSQTAFSTMAGRTRDQRRSPGDAYLRFAERAGAHTLQAYYGLRFRRAAFAYRPDLLRGFEFYRDAVQFEEPRGRQRPAGGPWVGCRL